MAVTWITDRDSIFIYCLKNNITSYTDWETGKTYNSRDILNRSTIDYVVYRRWRANYTTMLNILTSLRISTTLPVVPTFTNIILMNRVNCTYPGKPIISKYDIKETTQNDNPYYYMFNFFNHIIKLSGIDTSKYNIPETTEYLHYSQVNDLEAATQEAYEKLISPQLIYANTYISGQFTL